MSVSKEGEQVSVELRTGVIPTAIYANKLRRAAFVLLGKQVPKDVIMRDVTELNQELYRKLVEEMKLGKGDLIRITLTATYDKDSNKVSFSNIRIDRYVSQHEITTSFESRIKELENQVEKLRNENQKLRETLNKIKEILSM
ncbi:MAG: DUF2258 domain-containing protein [Thermoprotei archaeon]